MRGGGEGQSGRLGRGGWVEEGFGGQQVDNTEMDMVKGADEDGQEWLEEGEKWSSRPAG